MPGFDGIGPAGRRRMTGRGMGRCRPVYKAEEISSSDESLSSDQTGTVQGVIRRFGRGMGMGMGQGRRFGAGRCGRKGR